MSAGTQLMDGKASALLGLLPILLLCCVSGALADGNVTIEAITIFKKHEWVGKPTVYFRCRSEEKKYLADVVHKNWEYEFKGQESFQPLTTLHGEKCKRCGIYEQDTVKHDDTFFEAELCPDDFAKSPLGRLVFFREKEVNASLLCPGCVPRTSESESVDTGTQSTTDEEEDEDDKGAGIAFVIIILLVVLLFILGSVAYSKWRQKQRREQQARFVKMFEDDDDLEAEFGLKDDL